MPSGHPASWRRAAGAAGIEAPSDSERPAAGAGDPALAVQAWTGPVVAKLVARALRARLESCDRVMAAAFVLAVGGWGLMWAEALELVALGPIWIPVGAFAFGLVLAAVRQCRRRAPEPGG
jgi:hypothetical protein